MLSKIYTASLKGIDGEIVCVETDLTRGLPAFNLVGLGDKIIKESGERIRSAMVNSGLRYPQSRITINLSPANKQKEGSHFDLPIALGIMNAQKEEGLLDSKNICVFGELGLDGRVLRINGALPLGICAKENGFTKIVLPMDNAKEAALVKGLEVYPVKTLMEAHEFIEGNLKIKPYINEENNKEEEFIYDYKDIYGQESSKRAMMIAAAGGHGILMIGSPGVGKTMLARALPSIMPPLTYEEKLEVTKIYSVAGLLTKEVPMINHRPYRCPHSTITNAALLGGGAYPRPGELSLAHRGVMFLDELSNFDGRTLDLIRQPIEDGEVKITRQKGSVSFPAKSILACASNPCKCGYAGDETHMCTCTPGQLSSYMSKLTGPIIERIDLHIKVNKVNYEEIEAKSGMSSLEMRNLVLKARALQENRYKEEKIQTNSELTAEMMDKYCFIGEEQRKIMELAYNKFELSVRTHSKIIKIARTIADLSGSDNIEVAHLTEALQYRGLENLYRRASGGN